MLDVKIKKFDDRAIVPAYAKAGDAGADLCSIDSAIIYPGHRQLLSTGIGMEIPDGWVGLIHPRSGIANKFGISIVNSPGTVDSGYRGIIFVNIINHGTEPFIVGHGDRIAQIVFQQVSQACFGEVGELGSSDRGEAGHGSTGVNDGRV